MNMRGKVAIFLVFAISFFTVSCNLPSGPKEEDFPRGPFDMAYSILETSNGYIFLGQTFQEGYDIWIVEIGRQGNVLRQKTYGEVRKDEVAYSFDKTNDGGYILGGYSKLWSSFYMKSYILKIKADGQKEWEIEDGSVSQIKNIKVTSDGGFVVVGDNYVAKFSSNGLKQWERYYYSSYGNKVVLNWIEETSSGGYIAVGAEISSRGLIRERRDLYILELDRNGQKVWEYKMGGIGTPEEEAYCIQKTSGGDFIITGYVKYDTDYQLLVLKLKAHDNSIEWIKSYGGPEHEFGHHIRQTSDGGYIVVGAVESREWMSDIYILKLDQNGDKVWEKRFGGPYVDIGNFVVETSDGGYIIAGFYGKATTPEMYSEAYIIKLDVNGNLLWGKTYTHSGGKQN